MTNTAVVRSDPQSLARNGTSELAQQSAAFAPPCDVFENENEYLVLADVPGVEPSGLTVQFEQSELRIEATAAPAAGDSSSVVYRRAFRVGDQVDPAGIQAELKNGVLSVRLRKRESAKPRRIPVSSA